MKPFRVAMLLVAVLFLLACNRASTPADGGGAGEPAAVPAPADVRGAITSLTLAEGGAGDVMGTILIEGVLEEDTSHDRASVTVTNQTLILDNRSGESQAMGFQVLEVGQRVEARFTGPVMESYPVQATASEIVILPNE